jgi:hypothetical protein
MRSLVSLALVLAVAACGGGESSPDAAPDAMVDATVPGTGRVHVSWTMEDMNGPTTCEAVGATHVLLNLSLTTGEEEYAIFACSAGQGTTQEIDPASYIATVVLVDMLGGLYAGTLDTSVFISGDGRRWRWIRWCS